MYLSETGKPVSASRRACASILPDARAAKSALQPIPAQHLWQIQKGPIRQDRALFAIACGRP